MAKRRSRSRSRRSRGKKVACAHGKLKHPVGKRVCKKKSPPRRSRSPKKMSKSLKKALRKLGL